MTKEFPAFVCAHIFSGSSPVLFVSRADGDWQFLCGRPTHEGEIPKVVGINHLFENDKTLSELESLPENWEAQRSAVGAPWKKRKLSL